MEGLKRALRGVDIFTTWTGYCTMPLCYSLVLMVMWDITARQFGLYSSWAFDMEWFHYGWMMMFAMGYAVVKDQHVRIDLITQRYSPRGQAIVMALSYGLFVIPFMALTAIYAWPYFMYSIFAKETAVAGWTFPIWPIKISIFIGIMLMMPQCFAEMIRNILFAVKGVKV